MEQVAGASDNAGSAAESSTGDFGEGTGSLEEQLLNSLPPEGDESEESDAGDVSVDSAVVSAKDSKVVTPSPTPTQLFDLNGKVTLKPGAALSPDHIKELERGWLREADYTRKTQEVAKIRNEAQEVLNAQREILTDPRNLFKHIPPQKILSAFTKHEMLSHGLHAGGVSPQLWNKFLEWRKEGGDVDGADEAPKADPYSQQFAEFSRELEAIKRHNMSLAEQRQAEIQEREHANQMSAYDKEVSDALGEFPSVNKRALLVEMAASDGTKTIKELAQELNGALENRFQEYLKTKTQSKNKTVKAPKGTPVPIQRRAPKTFDDADEMIAKMYGNGELRGSEAFGS